LLELADADLDHLAIRWNRVAADCCSGINNHLQQR
jgi:hypothetical protein